jgi:hypothetical protein
MQKVSTNNPLVPVGESLPPTPLDQNPKPLQEFIPHSMLLDNYDIDLDTMRHLFLESRAHQYS